MLQQIVGRLFHTPRRSLKYRYDYSSRIHLAFECLEDRAMLSVTLNLSGSQVLFGEANVNVSTNVFRDQAEMSIVINPTNPLNIVAFSDSFIPSADGQPFFGNELDLYRSFDGGATWQTTTIDDGTNGLDDGFGFAISRFDPTIVFDATGRLYLGYGHIDLTFESNLIVARSDDGGASFAGFTAVETVAPYGGANLDKWHIATGTDPSTGNDAVYIAYLRGLPNFDREVRVAGSNDGGETFVISSALNDPSTSSRVFTQFPHPAVGPAGELYVSWQDVDLDKISIDVDLDGMFQSNYDFGTDVVVSNLSTSVFKAGIPAQPNRGIFNGPVLDVDRSGGPNNGRLYVVWADAVTLPSTNIYLSYSNNHGATWSAPVAVADTAASEFLPWIDVDQSTGSANVIYYKSAELDGGANEEVNVVMRSSLDSGATFGVPTILSTARSNADARENVNDKKDFLEYIGLAVHDGTIHALWSDNRDNPADDFEAYTASAAFVSSTGGNVLTIMGDDPGSDFVDDIIVRLSSLNQNYIEVIVNDELQFAGLLATIDSISIDGGLGADRILVDPAIWAAVDVSIVDPPQVMNVTISSTASGGHSHSFADVIAAAPDSGIQLIAIPVYEASSITVQFSEPMDDDSLQNAFHLTALSTIAAAPMFTDFSYDSLTFAATWSFDLVNLPTAVQFLLSLDDSIADSTATLLDGEWINPVSITTTNNAQSEFPSGDGQAGGVFKFLFTTVMPNAGDLNLVENADLTALLDHWGNFVTAFTDGDFSGDGYVDNDDLTMLLDTWGIDLRELLFLRDVNGDWKIDQDDINNIADVNGDGSINQSDIDLVFEQMGLDLSDALAA